MFSPYDQFNPNKSQEMQNNFATYGMGNNRNSYMPQQNMASLLGSVLNMDYSYGGDSNNAGKSIGKQAGSMAGSKLGTMAGNAILPGIGGFIGGWAGGQLGGMAGEKLGGMFG